MAENESAAEYQYRGDQARREKRYGDALELYAKSLAIEPDRPWALLGHGDCLRNLGRIADSLPWFERAAQSDETRRGATQCHANALASQSRWELALKFWEHALELNPADPYAQTGRFEAARKVTQQLHDDAEDLRRSRAYVQAVGIYDRALAIEPDYTYAIAGRAECLRMLDRPEESIPSFERALLLDPGHMFAEQGLAAALNQLDRFAEALGHWDRTIELAAKQGLPDTFARGGRERCLEGIRRGGSNT